MHINNANKKATMNQRPYNTKSNADIKTTNIKRQNNLKPNIPPHVNKNNSKINPKIQNQNIKNARSTSNKKNQNIKSTNNLHNQKIKKNVNPKSNEIARKKQAQYAARMAAQKRAYIIEKKRRQKNFFTTLLYRAVLFFIILSLLLSAFALIMYIDLNKTNKVNEEDFIYYLGDRKKETVSYSKIIRNGEMYINFSDVAKEFGLAVSGSLNNMKFISGSNSEYIRFVNDDYIAYINGAPVRMKQKAILEHENMWIPLDFIVEYADGITVQYDEEKNTLTIKRIAFKNGYKDITFKIKSADPIKSIEEPAEDIKT